MDLLGIGPLELLFVFILIILVFGPQDLAKTGKKIGRFLSQIVKSENWMAIKTVSQELRSLPNKLMREAEFEAYLSENPPKTIAPPKSSARPEPSASSTEDEIPFEAGLKAWTTTPADIPAEEDK